MSRPVSGLLPGVCSQGFVRLSRLKPCCNFKGRRFYPRSENPHPPRKKTSAHLFEGLFKIHLSRHLGYYLHVLYLAVPVYDEYRAGKEPELLYQNPVIGAEGGLPVVREGQNLLDARRCAEPSDGEG